MHVRALVCFFGCLALTTNVVSCVPCVPLLLFHSCARPPPLRRRVRCDGDRRLSPSTSVEKGREDHRSVAVGRLAADRETSRSRADRAPQGPPTTAALTQKAFVYFTCSFVCGVLGVLIVLDCCHCLISVVVSLLVGSLVMWGSCVSAVLRCGGRLSVGSTDAIPRPPSDTILPCVMP